MQKGVMAVFKPKERVPRTPLSVRKPAGPHYPARHRAEVPQVQAASNDSELEDHRAPESGAIRGLRSVWHVIPSSTITVLNESRI